MVGHPSEPVAKVIGAYYFVRANGDTLHSDGRRPECFVAGEPVTAGKAYFSHVDYCLRHGIARVGWPDTGDLRQLPRKIGALCRCYDFSSIEPHERQYLLAFLDIAVGSVVLMPDKDRPGTLYIGNVIKPYEYFHHPPQHPYECAHRVGVDWDRNVDGFLEYRAAELGLGIRGGFWARAFHRIDASQKASLIERIVQVRGRAVGRGR
jgi:hypothetical protein